MEQLVKKLNRSKRSLWRNLLKKKSPCTVMDDLLSYDNSIHFYTESFFKNLVAIERKRAERSNKPFMLVVLDIEKIMVSKCNEADREGVAEKFYLLLKNATREIDIKGWFSKGAQVGIIFTEINGDARQSILNKISRNLNAIFNRDEAKDISLVHFIFPDNQITVENDHDTSKVNFYNNILKKKITRKSSLVAKRAIDIIGSMFGMLLFSPIFIFIPIIIKRGIL